MTDWHILRPFLDGRGTLAEIRTWTLLELETVIFALDIREATARLAQPNRS